MSCLDLGCGPGEVMRLMAQRVGPTGRIVGTFRRRTAILPSNLSMNSRRYSLACSTRRAERLELLPAREGFLRPRKASLLVLPEASQSLTISKTIAVA